MPATYKPQDYPIPSKYMTIHALLPVDADRATLIGRVQMPGEGPRVVTIRTGDVFDITDQFDSVSKLCEEPDPLSAVGGSAGVKLGSVEEILANTPVNVRDENKP